MTHLMCLHLLRIEEDFMKLNMYDFAIAMLKCLFQNDQPVVALDARTAFEKLTEREQLYAHYLSR